jgi:surfactin synthase thioesterase subunit
VKQPRLFCLPYAGGGASIYRTWLAKLQPAIEVRPLQPPGRENRWREPAYCRLDDLVQCLMSDLRTSVRAPYAMFGHSLGALVSFELARALRREGFAEPDHLFISAYRAPHLPDNKEHIHMLPNDRLIERIRALGGTPKEVLENEDLLRIVLPTVRADAEVAETYAYHPEPPFSCAIVALGGIRDHGITSRDLEAWREHTTGRFSLRMFAGDHFFIQREESALLAMLRAELAADASA